MIRLKINRTVILFFGLIASNHVWAHEPNSCERQNRNPNLCYKMKGIKSLLNLLEGQDHLMQINYPYMDAVSENMGQMIDRVLVQMGNSSHTKPLADVRTEVTRINSLARSSDIRVFNSINNIRIKCQSCHSQINPTSGIEWNNMQMITWETIQKNCLKEGRNPLVCKLMHGVASQVTYLDTIEMSQVRNLKTVRASAAEGIRMIDQILSVNTTGSTSADLQAFQNLKSNFNQIVDYSIRGDNLAFDFAREIKKSCTLCSQLEE